MLASLFLACIGECGTCLDVGVRHLKYIKACAWGLSVLWRHHTNCHASLTSVFHQPVGFSICVRTLVRFVKYWWSCWLANVELSSCCTRNLHSCFKIINLIIRIKSWFIVISINADELIVTIALMHLHARPGNISTGVEGALMKLILNVDGACRFKMK